MNAEGSSPLQTILIVDDNAQNRQLAEAQLGAAGYTVTCASSGEEALELFARYTPDLILLDIMMPRLNGFETFRRLRQLPGGAETPIVFITAAADPATHKEALQIGADDFLCKPINRTELLIRVRSLLRVRRLHTELRHGYELIRNQRDALLRAQQQKEQLMAFVVHDLNNRLTTIVMLSEFLQDESLFSEAARASVRDISNAAGAIHRMVQNLLDISRNEDGRLTLRLAELDLSSLLARACQRYTDRARLREQSLVLDVETGSQGIYADGELLSRLIENLLDNAIKYSPPGTLIRVSARPLDGDSNFEVRIADQGPGIPAEHRERVFEKYAQLDNPGEGQVRAGRGLGLTFCRLAAEAHGGRIFVEENSPRGSVFCVQLPRRANPT